MASQLHRELAELRQSSPVTGSPVVRREAEASREAEATMATQLMETMQQLRQEQDVLEEEAARVAAELTDQKQLNRVQADRIGELEAQLASAGGAVGPSGDAALERELAHIAQKCEELHDLNQRLVAEHNEQTEALQAEIAALKATSETSDPQQSPRWQETAEAHAAEIDALTAQIAQLEAEVAAGKQPGLSVRERELVKQHSNAEKNLRWWVRWWAERQTATQADLVEAHLEVERLHAAATVSSAEDAATDSRLADAVVLVETQGTRLATVTQDTLAAAQADLVAARLEVERLQAAATVSSAEDAATDNRLADAVALVETQGIRLATVTQDTLTTLKQKYATLEHKCEQAELDGGSAEARAADLEAAAAKKDVEIEELRKQVESLSSTMDAEVDREEKAASEARTSPAPPPATDSHSPLRQATSDEIYTDEDFEDVSELDTSFDDGTGGGSPSTSPPVTSQVILDDELGSSDRHQVQADGDGHVSPEAVALVEEQGERLRNLMEQYSQVAESLEEERQARKAVEDTLDMERRAAAVRQRRAVRAGVLEYLNCPHSF